MIMRSQRWTRRAAAASLGLALAATGAGCGSSSGSASAGSGAIKLGGIYTLSPQPFGNDAEKMVKTVFDQVNAQGGIAGRRIDYLAGDDVTQPTRAAQLARQYAGDGVVAMVGSTSFVDCGTNKTYYRQQKLMSIQAIGSDPFCFSSPNTTPVNVGPFTSITADLYYASQYLHDTRLCAFMTSTPGTKDAVAGAVKRWTGITGQTMLIDDAGLPMNETDFTPELLRAKQAHCQAIFYNGGDTVALSIMKAAKNQGMQDVHFLFDAPAYTQQLAQSANGMGMKVYLASEFEPFTAASTANAAWRALATNGGVRPTSFSQGGYIAATWMVSVLKSIKGPITRASVTKALLAGTPYSTPMVGSPLVFGPAKAHAPNQAIKMVTLAGGGWQVINKQFFTLPGSPS